MIGSKPICI